MADTGFPGVGRRDLVPDWFGCPAGEALMGAHAEWGLLRASEGMQRRRRRVQRGVR
jgi:hypothetical protein